MNESLQDASAQLAVAHGGPPVLEEAADVDVVVVPLVVDAVWFPVALVDIVVVMLAAVVTLPWPVVVDAVDPPAPLGRSYV